MKKLQFFSSLYSVLVKVAIFMLIFRFNLIIFESYSFPSCFMKKNDVLFYNLFLQFLHHNSDKSFLVK